MNNFYFPRPINPFAWAFVLVAVSSFGGWSFQSKKPWSDGRVVPADI